MYVCGGAVFDHFNLLGRRGEDVMVGGWEEGDLDMRGLLAMEVCVSIDKTYSQGLPRLPLVI